MSVLISFLMPPNLCVRFRWILQTHTHTHMHTSKQARHTQKARACVLRQRGGGYLGFSVKVRVFEAKWLRKSSFCSIESCFALTRPVKMACRFRGMMSCLHNVGPSPFNVLHCQPSLLIRILESKKPPDVVPFFFFFLPLGHV